MKEIWHLHNKYYSQQFADTKFDYSGRISNYMK